MPDDHVHFAADAGVTQQLLDIHQAGLGPVDLVFRRAVAEHAAGNGNLGIFDGQLAIGVVDSQSDFRAPQWLAVPRSGEDDVFHLPATQGLSALLPHDPGQGIHNIGFSGAVGPHHSADAWL